VLIILSVRRVVDKKIREEVLPIKGYLLQEQKLIGLYVKGTLLKIEPQKIPQWLNKEILKGKFRGVVKLEVLNNRAVFYLVDLSSNQRWTILETES